MSDWVQEDAFVPLEFELRFGLQKFVNDVSFDFHDFGEGFGSDGALGWLVVRKVVRVEDVAETSDEVKVVVLLFDTAWNDNVNRVDALTLFDDLATFFVSFLSWFHPDFNDLVSSKIWKQRTVSENFIKSDLLSFELIKLNIDESSIDFFSQCIKLSFINKSFFI